MSVAKHSVLDMETEAAINRTSRERPYRQLTTTKTVLISFVVALVGGVLLYVGGLGDWCFLISLALVCPLVPG
ncbi:hypothetical protein GCM10009850_121910 [Nonomuraea monospora]|uniref:Uncharacterized protein n=1 Tax=Nonomuraea monospora TaxID=568818 RepID=A0ABN3D5W3_9ACTN